MNNRRIACILISLSAFFAINNASAFNLRERSLKINSVDDTSFVIPEVDLSQLNIAPKFEIAVYKQRLDSLTKQIPLDYNAYVQGYINLYAFRKREQVERMLGLSEFYFPMVEKVFKENNIPTEFKYLAIVESALNPYAVSRVGATGMWQFMFTTAKMYNLKITSHIDERRDPLKATQAAAHYFVDMYKRYGDWLLVIAAYNCGPGNVNRAIKKSGGQKTFWAIRNYLPEETRGYVPAYIAATYIMNYAEEHNLYPAYPTFSFMTDTVQLNKPVAFKDIEKLCGVSAEELKILNPIFKKDFVPAYSETFVLKVPATRRDLVLLNKDSLYQSFPNLFNSESVFVLNTDPMANAKTIFKTHVVKRGESLGRVANKYNVSVSDLKKWNKIKSSNLMAGQRLKIKKEIKVTQSVTPVNIAKSESKEENKQLATVNTSKESKVIYETVYKPVSSTHKVKKGENLSLIANKYDVQVDQIKSWNKLKTSRLSAGQKLIVFKIKAVQIAKKAPAKSKELAVENTEQVASNEPQVEKTKSNDELEVVTVKKDVNYVVKRGDNLAKIANKFDVSVNELRAWNKLKSYNINSGQNLTIQKSEQKVIVKKSDATDNTQQLADSKKIPNRVEEGLFVFYKVEEGDTLWSIAKRYEGMTVEKLRELNGLKSNESLKAGMVLKVSKKS